MKNQENLSSPGKRQSTDADAEITQMLQISDKDFKAAVIKRFLVRINTLQRLER